MLTQLLHCLESGDAYSQDDLAKALHTNADTVRAGIRYLEQTGYLRSVSLQSGCSGSCKGCPGCGAEREGLPVVWERVK